MKEISRTKDDVIDQETEFFWLIWILEYVGFPETTYRWLSEDCDLQCVSNGDTAVLRQAVDIVTDVASDALTLVS